MTPKKISINEFVEWGNEIWQLAETVFKDSNETSEEKKITTKVISAFCVRIISGNTFALGYFNNIFSEEFEKLPKEIKETKFNFPCENGVKRKMTGEEWSQYLFQRIEEHHRTRVGKEIKDQDLPSTIERINKIKGWGKDEEKREQLLTKIYSTDRESYDLVWGIVDLNEKYFEITNKKLLEGEGDITEGDLQHSRYFFEDLSQIIFKAQEAIEDEKEKPKIPEKKKDRKKHEVKTLEEEKKELERQKKDLKDKLSNTSLSPAKRASLEEDLIENKKQCETVQAKLDKLQRELKDTDDGKKVDLALYLGIFAAVVAVICLIVILVRRPRHRDY